MEEDILSDFVPSNIVSRQVCSIPYFMHTRLFEFFQVSDGESEYASDVTNAGEDEILSDKADSQVNHICSITFMTFIFDLQGCRR
jgi:hypothetical protein